MINNDDDDKLFTHIEYQELTSRCGGIFYVERKISP